LIGTFIACALTGFEDPVLGLSLGILVVGRPTASRIGLKDRWRLKTEVRRISRNLFKVKRQLGIAERVVIEAENEWRLRAETASKPVFAHIRTWLLLFGVGGYCALAAISLVNLINPIFALCCVIALYAKLAYECIDSLKYGFKLNLISAELRLEKAKSSLTEARARIAKTEHALALAQQRWLALKRDRLSSVGTTHRAVGAKDFSLRAKEMTTGLARVWRLFGFLLPSYVRERFLEPDLAEHTADLYAALAGATSDRHRNWLVIQFTITAGLKVLACAVIALRRRLVDEFNTMTRNLRPR
jgi:hypothetical protein